MTMHRAVYPPFSSPASLLALFIVGLALGLSSPSSAQQPELLPLPEVELVEGVEAGVQEVFPQLLETIERLMADESASGRQLAEAFGDLGRAALYYEVTAVIEPALQNSQRLDPLDYRWPYYLGAYYQDQLRRVAEATEQLQRARELRAGDPAIDLRLGQLALLAERPDQAPEYFERARRSEGFAAIALYGLGRSASLRGDDAAAVELFEAALDLEPDAAEVHQQLGLTYRKLRDLDSAREHLSKEVSGSLSFPDPLMASLKEDFSRSHLFAGMEAQVSGRMEDAVAEYRKAVELDPKSGVGHEALAAALEAAGDLDAAIDEYRVAVSLLPNDAMVRVLAAKALTTRDGATDEALELYRGAVDLAPELAQARKGLASLQLLQERQLDEASEHLRVVLETDPEDLGARLQLARVLILSGEADRAVEELEKILAVDPMRPEVLLNYGQALARSERASEARAELVYLLELPSASLSIKAVVHKELAELASAEGLDAEALEHWRQAADLAPDLLPIGLGYAEALSADGQHEEAIAALEMILVINPEDEAARLGRARALAAAGRMSEARSELESLIDTSPDLLEATLDLAALQARQGDFEGAIKNLSRARERAEGAEVRALLSFEIGGMWQMAGDDRKAVESYTAATEDHAEFKDAHFNMAVSLGRLGRTEEAMEHLGRVIEIDPKDEESYLALAQALASEGLFAEARDTLQRGLDHASESPILTSALVQLLLASPDQEVRDATAAVPLALALHERDPSIQNGAMVAASLGSAGRYAEAADWQARVVKEAAEAGLPDDQLQRMRSDLALYRQRAGGG